MLRALLDSGCSQKIILKQFTHKSNRRLLIDKDKIKYRPTQENFLCSLVLKFKVFLSKYLQEHSTRCITRAALFLKNVPGTFSTRHIKANPLGESVDCFSPLHSTRVLTLF